MDYSHWKSHFEGRLLTQADDEYAVTRRIWNRMIDKKPALIARCASAADVRAGVKLARAERMTISVRGGGHGVAGNAVCDGGKMLDLSLMKQISVDPIARDALGRAHLLELNDALRTMNSRVVRMALRDFTIWPKVD